MLPKVTKITELKDNISTVTIFDNIDQFSLSFLVENEISYVKKKKFGKKRGI